jgi:hypothetical protein
MSLAPPAARVHLQEVAVNVNKSLFCFDHDSGATSSGVFAGDDPLKFYFPLFLYHVCTVFALSRAINALLRRANVPLVISQILVRSRSVVFFSVSGKARRRF